MRLEVEPLEKLAAVILVGGESFRMGTAKSLLTLNEKTFVEILVSKFQSRQIPVVIVDAAKSGQGSSFPGVSYLTDRRDGFGPLEGIRVGLEYLHDKAELAFITGCDSPLLKIDLVEFLASQAEDFQAVIPQSETRIFGLTAVYRTAVHSLVDARILAGERRVLSLSHFLHANLISLETLRPIDPDLVSFMNVNTPAEYQRLVETYCIR